MRNLWVTSCKRRKSLASVVWRNGGLPELIRHGIDGFVLREVSIQAIQEQIQSPYM